MNILEKLKEKFIKNEKYILGIITGILISGTTVYAATIISAVNVSYSNTSSKLSSTNVQNAIDELYDKAKNNCPDGYECIKVRYAFGEPTDSSPSSFDEVRQTFPMTAVAVRLLNGSKSICIYRGSKSIECFANNSTTTEITHMQEVYGTNNCAEKNAGNNTKYLECNNSNTICQAYSNGIINCYTSDTGYGCYILADNSVNCNNNGGYHG